MKKSTSVIKLSENPKQAVGGKRILKNPDVPRKGNNPKDKMDPLPPKRKK